jgi:hypothetical protein
MYTCVSPPVYMCMSACQVHIAYIYIHIYIHTYIYINIHIYIYKEVYLRQALSLEVPLEELRLRHTVH